MRLIISQESLKENIYTIIKRIGYYFLGKKEDEINCIRPLGGNRYPRFHIYLKEGNGILIFNLHLDQKKPIYQNAPSHSAEYSSEVVKEEAKRIKEIIEKLKNQN